MIESAQFLARNRGQRQQRQGMREEQNDPSENVKHPSQGNRPICNCSRLKSKGVGSNQAREMVKTIRQFLRLNIFEIKRRDYGQIIKDIIDDVWKAFRDHKNVSKQIFTVMFNQKIYLEFANKFNLKHILDKYYESDYRLAMNILRAQLYDNLLKANLARIIRERLRIKDCYRIRKLIQSIKDFVDKELDKGGQVKFYRQEKYDRQYTIYKFKQQPYIPYEDYLNYQRQNEQSQGLLGFPPRIYPQ